MSKREAKLLITDILEAIDKVERYVTGMSFETFVVDDKTVDAVVRNFEIIGEAARQIPETFKETYPGGIWRIFVTCLSMNILVWTWASCGRLLR
jgi:uncharacterized protein with HEPN domain